MYDSAKRMLKKLLADTFAPKRTMVHVELSAPFSLDNPSSYVKIYPGDDVVICSYSESGSGISFDYGIYDADGSVMHKKTCNSGATVSTQYKIGQTGRSSIMRESTSGTWCMAMPLGSEHVPTYVGISADISSTAYATCDVFIIR